MLTGYFSTRNFLHNESERHEEMDEHDMTALVVLNDDECILANTERVANSEDVDSSEATKKKLSCLEISDPTIYGNLKASEETVQAVIEALENGACNGYTSSVGNQEAREAVAEYLSRDGVEVDSKDVILCSGCSSSLEHCITVLADGAKNQNILIPRPGFPIYRTLAEHVGVEVRYYNLIPENNWEADLCHLASPDRRQYRSYSHQQPFKPMWIKLQRRTSPQYPRDRFKYRIPVIADEIYENLVFPGEVRIHSVSDSCVPILICGGIAKRFLVPGWRLGWIVVHDDISAFDEVRKALNCLTQRIIGSNTFGSRALPENTEKYPQSAF
ncbi:hypothetical protein JTB14_025606 [Gonioctena quinquepunctata]|nr:hypothetical protein JTB14_025606 [Gonioctena quinquepunctata]